MAGRRPLCPGLPGAERNSQRLHRPAHHAVPISLSASSVFVPTILSGEPHFLEGGHLRLRRTSRRLALGAGCRSTRPGKAYKDAARKHHPEQGSDPEVIKRVNASWERIKQSFGRV